MLDLAPESETILQQEARRAGISVDTLIKRTFASPAHEKIVLSERDFARFVELIETPPAPTDALRAAMADYQKQKASYPEANL